MGSLVGMRILVVGAGALGRASAAVLHRRGAQVTVVDDAPPGGNASAIAAGMIAPALEAALEDAEPERAELYRRAAGRWPDFAAACGLRLIDDGTDWRGAAEPLAGRLDALGFAYERRPGGLYLPGENRVCPDLTMSKLAEGFAVIPGKVTAVERGRIHLESGASPRAHAIVLATGWEGATLQAPGLEAMLGRIAPVKGHILLIKRERAVERTTRGEGVYLVPAERGVLAGATMEPGCTDRHVDPAIVEQLRAAAAALEPKLEGAPLNNAYTGIRGATPDGLPLAGATPVDGVFAALAPRRNGWLLAPLVAETVAAAIAQEPPPPFADMLRPDRFGPP